MTLDDRIYAWIARRVAMGATPSDRAIQTQFGFKSTDDALAALNRLRSHGRITVEQVGNRRVIDCGALVVDIEGEKPAMPIPDVVAPKAPKPVIEPVKIAPKAKSIATPKSPQAGKYGATIDPDFIAQVEAYLAQTKMSNSKFGIEAVGDNKFISGRLRNPMIERTRVKVRAYMAENPNGGDAQRVKAVRDDTLPAVTHIIAPEPSHSPIPFPAPDPYEFCLAQIASLEINQGCKMKPRISAKVLGAQINSGVPFDQFITSLINMGLACYLEDAQ